MFVVVVTLFVHEYSVKSAVDITIFRSGATIGIIVTSNRHLKLQWCDEEDLHLEQLGEIGRVMTNLVQLPMVKIGELTVKIGGLIFGQILEWITMSHVGHMQGMGIMDQIHLFKMEMDSMILMTQIFILIGVSLILDEMLWAYNLVIFLGSSV